MKAIYTICLKLISTLIKIIIFISIFMLTNQQKTMAQCHIDDWTALKSIYESTNGDFWTNRTGWDLVINNQVTPPINCNLEDLFGVRLNETGRVSCIDLDGDDDCNLSWIGNGNNLTGNIPPEIGLLSDLEYLSFDNNNLQGSIPQQIGNLINLKILLLYNNQLSGSLPYELSGLINLTYIGIVNNNLSGCYDHRLLDLLCLQLPAIGGFKGNGAISNGNNFDASWMELCLPTVTGAGVCTEECTVYPGDLNNDGIVDNIDFTLKGLYSYNVGLTRASEHQNTDWYAHPANNWGVQQFNGADIKHHDTNGDGTIDENDCDAVEENMGLQWMDEIDPPTPPTLSDYQVRLYPIGTINANLLRMNVALENVTGEDLVLNRAYFTIRYSDLADNIDTVIFNFLPSSWIGTFNFNFESTVENILEDYEIKIGFKRLDGSNSVGSGIIGELALSLNGANNARIASNSSMVNLKAVNVGTINNTGNGTLLKDQPLQINLGENTCSTNLCVDETQFQNEFKSIELLETNGYTIIDEGQEVKYLSNRVTLRPGFKIKAGARFTAGYGACERADNGLNGKYYDNIDFTGTTVLQIASTIDFNWQLGSPHQALEPDTFSARWEGFVEAPTSGLYTFFTNADDGVRLWINDQLIIDHWFYQVPTERQGNIQMLAGKKVAIKMECYENVGGAVAQLRWEGPGTGKQIVPNKNLFLN